MCKMAIQSLNNFFLTISTELMFNVLCWSFTLTLLKQVYVALIFSLFGTYFQLCWSISILFKNKINLKLIWLPSFSILPWSFVFPKKPRNPKCIETHKPIWSCSGEILPSDERISIGLVRYLWIHSHNVFFLSANDHNLNLPP